MKGSSETFSYKLLFYHDGNWGPKKRNNLTKSQSWLGAEFKKDKALLTFISEPVVFFETVKNTQLLKNEVS